MNQIANPPVAVVGAFVGRPDRVAEQSLEEMIFDAAAATVADAGLTLDDIDGVVISANDQTDGRVISCMVTSGPSGGVGRDLTMIPSASEHALVYAYMRLVAGLGRNALVLSWGKPSESVAPEHAELVAAEPFLLRQIGMNDTIAAALQASALERDDAGEAAGRVVAWPLTEADVPDQGDAVCGLVLAVEDAIPAEASPAWIKGVGWATDRYELGDRDLAAMPALRSAATAAYEMAGAGATPVVDAARVSCPSRRALGPVLDALDLSDFSAQASTIHPCSPDELAYPTHAAGLVAMALAANEIRSGPEDARPDRTSVGASLHGFAGQGAAVTVFGATKER